MPARRQRRSSLDCVSRHAAAMPARPGTHAVRWFPGCPSIQAMPCHAMPCRAMPTAPGRRMLWTWEPHERAGIGELLAAVRTRCQEKPQKETAGVGG